MSDIVLCCEGLVKRFGGITATDHVSLLKPRTCTS
jgi:ABC-type branched-subunit amino acid transport system ATPase component